MKQPEEALEADPDDQDPQPCLSISICDRGMKEKLSQSVQLSKTDSEKINSENGPARSYKNRKNLARIIKNVEGEYEKRSQLTKFRSEHDKV